MNDIPVKSYVVHSARTFAALSLPVLFALPCFYLLFVTHWRELNRWEKSIWLVLLLGTLAICGHFFAKGLRWRKSGVTVDAQGLWPSHASREASLIPWAAVADTRDRSFKGRLEVIDAGGRALLGLDHKLVNFHELPDLLARKITPPDIATRLPARFSLPIHYYVVWIGALLVLGLMFKFLIGLKGVAPVIAIGAILLMVANQTRTTVIQMVAGERSLALKTLFGKRIVNRPDVVGVQIRPDRQLRSPRPQVFLTLKDNSEIMLHFASIDAISLKRFLEAWRQME